MYSRLAAIIISIPLMTACTEPSGAPGRGLEKGGALSKSNVGTVAGAVGGGVLGSTIGSGAGQTAAIIGGGLLGGLLGHSVGQSLDNADLSAYESASQNALETGNVQNWRNTQTGHYGTIIPNTSYTDMGGQYCREYNQTIYVDGQRHTGHGTACRDQGGSWQLVG
jgi:surface antigen